MALIHDRTVPYHSAAHASACTVDSDLAGTNKSGNKWHMNGSTTLRTTRPRTRRLSITQAALSCKHGVILRRRLQRDAEGRTATSTSEVSCGTQPFQAVRLSESESSRLALIRRGQADWRSQ